ncbi:hypothetical protein ACJ73_08033 [Blastomyces percursus]|uniref:Uncharacterized protein n=1 Tax=Blastomyces percursus TaxID=1658174 RepID=A0A1J9QWR7_9EURO|nr:hypothetical protein ACJ73_08033 [Blastomyces percursus]
MPSKRRSTTTRHSTAKDTPPIPAPIAKAPAAKIPTAITETTVPYVPYDLRRKHIPRIDPPPPRGHPYPNPATYMPTSATREITRMRNHQKAKKSTSTTVDKICLKTERICYKNSTFAASISLSKKNIEEQSTTGINDIEDDFDGSLPPLPPSEDPDEEEAARQLYSSKEKFRKIVHDKKVREAYRALREADNEIFTSELEDSMDDYMREVDFSVEVNLRIYLNKRLTIRKILPRTTVRSLDLTDIEETTISPLAPLVEDLPYSIATRSAISKKSRSTREVNIPSSPPIPSSNQSARTSQLLQQNSTRLDAIRNAGEFQRQLMDRFRCRQQSCTNQNNYCYPDPVDTSLHYNITVPQHESWANAISSGDATLQQLPMKLLQYWQTVQGPISRESCQPIKRSAMQQTKSAMERMLEMQQQMQEQYMQQRMMDQMEAMEAMEEKQERREELRERRQIQRARQLDQQLYSQREPHFNSYLPSQSSTSGPPLVSNPFPKTVPPKSSSPIQPVSDDIDVLIPFFDWRISRTSNAEKRRKWEQAKDRVLTNDWSIKDLKDMYGRL